MSNYQNFLWQRRCAQISLDDEDFEDAILSFLAINECTKKIGRYKKKIYWIHPIFQKRAIHGFYSAIYPIMLLEQGVFRNYYRMTRTQLEELVTLIAPTVQKQTVIREPISAAERISSTIRYLASGDSMASMSYHYLIGPTTVTHIIKETCEAIWDTLVEIILPYQLISEDWLGLANNFEKKWDFPHCIGAIDGKHVCPDNAGSEYYNYKHSHSIILLGICNADYIFTYVDIGAYDRRSDGGVFRDSMIGKKFHEKEKNLPNPQRITADGPPLPYVLVGDEAFQLTNFLLRPYPGRGGLNQERIIFNYRLSRARRTIENAFGILANQWRVLRGPIICNVDKCIRIIQATVCLHNWLKLQDTVENQYVPPTLIDQETSTGITPGAWRRDNVGSTFTNISRSRSNNTTRAAVQVRLEFCKYFSSEGAISWQFDHC